MIGDGGQASISLTLDTDRMHVHIVESSQLEVCMWSTYCTRGTVLTAN